VAVAGPHVVLHAVPGADEVHFVFREIESHRGLVGAKPLLDLGDGQTFAGGAALVQAEIVVGVEFAVVAEHADLLVADKDDAAVTIPATRGACGRCFRPYASHLGFHRTRLIAFRRLFVLIFWRAPGHCRPSVSLHLSITSRYRMRPA